MKPDVMRARVALIVLLSLVLPACGGHTPPQLPNLPTVVAGADQDIKAASIKALGILQATGTVVDRASQIVEQAAATGAISADVLKPVRGGFVAVSTHALAAIHTIERGEIQDWAALKVKLDPILRDVQTVIDLLASAAPTVRDRVTDLLSTALQIFFTFMQPGVPRAALEAR